MKKGDVTYVNYNLPTQKDVLITGSGRLTNWYIYREGDNNNNNMYLKSSIQTSSIAYRVIHI